MNLSNLLLAAMLIGTPLVAAADPAPKAEISDEAHYEALEKATPEAAKFEGGSDAVYIGGSALTVVLIILLIVIVL
jgi:hypothetical protein